MRASKSQVDAVIHANIEAEDLYFVRRNKMNDVLEWEVCKRDINCEHKVLYWFTEYETAVAFEIRLKAQHVADAVINSL